MLPVHCLRLLKYGIQCSAILFSFMYAEVFFLMLPWKQYYSLFALAVDFHTPPATLSRVNLPVSLILIPVAHIVWIIIARAYLPLFHAAFTSFCIPPWINPVSGTKASFCILYVLTLSHTTQDTQKTVCCHQEKN